MTDEHNPYLPGYRSFPKAARASELRSSPSDVTTDTSDLALELAVSSFAIPGTILTLGNARAFHAHALTARGFHVVMAAPSKKILQFHRRNTNGFEQVLSAGKRLDCIKDSCVDGILAGKGWLNGFRTIGPALYDAFRILKDNGVCVLVLRNRFSIAECLAYIQHGQYRRAFERARRNGAFIPGDERDVLAWYHSLRSVKRAARGLFTIQKVVGLNIITPPPSFRHIHDFHPRLIRAAARVEARIRSLPILAALGDYFIVVLERFE